MAQKWLQGLVSSHSFIASVQDGAEVVIGDGLVWKGGKVSLPYAAEVCGNPSWMDRPWREVGTQAVQWAGMKNKGCLSPF